MEGVDKKDALIQTGRTRLRPILMTALTTILAMVTMALGLGDGAEMTQPMAIVTIGRPHLRHPADLACGAGALRRIP